MEFFLLIFMQYICIFFRFEVLNKSNWIARAIFGNLVGKMVNQQDKMTLLSQ